MIIWSNNLIIRPNKSRYVGWAPDSHGSVTQLRVFTHRILMNYNQQIMVLVKGGLYQPV